jgi:hypothetical protein
MPRKQFSGLKRKRLKTMETGDHMHSLKPCFPVLARGFVFMQASGHTKVIYMPQSATPFKYQNPENCYLFWFF